jgi:hypothetical protein
LGDLDGDGDLDVAHNGFWMEQASPIDWVEHEIDPNWPADVGVLIIDIDGNGNNDVVLAASESSNERFSWYEAADPVNGPWTEHVIDPTTSVLHTFKAADMDLDGDLDLVTAEMHQSADPDEVSVYLNDGDALSWTQLVVATSGSHNLRVADFGSDGDIDIFGANWNDSAPNTADIEMWESQLQSGLPLDQWQRHIVETSMPWRAVFVAGEDINTDGLPDLVTGGWWYPNPGALGGNWVRTPIGAPLNNMAAVYDFDSDGDMDVLGTNGQHSGDDFSWARNDGTGVFTNFDIAPSGGGDFLQGVSVDQVIAGGGTEIVLSWHNGGPGTSMFTVPGDPTDPNWPLPVISPTRNGEQIATGDIDGDGLIDVHLGTNWLRQLGDGSFETRPGVTMSGGVPDRVSMADIDDDGDLDVVIGAEGARLLIWGENQDNGSTWTEHVIATDVNYFSVDIDDIDGDGDIDVVGGAHQGNGEVFIYENAGQGATWITHVVDPGDATPIDHHDGTQLVDMDLDGDLDIITIGWQFTSLVIYENLAITGGGVDITPPSIGSVATAGPNQVSVEFSEPLDPITAEEVANFTVSDGVTVSSATLGPDSREVTLATSTLTEGFIYTLTVNNVEDLAGNAIAPDTQTTFSLAANQDPVATDTTESTVADTPVSFTLTASDPDGDPLTYTVTTDPANGTYTGVGADLTYTPDAGYLGDDTIGFTVTDGRGGSDTATVTITIDPAPPPDPGLVAYWPFGEGSGTTTADGSGNGYDGTLVNGPAWTVEDALDFDGVDDYVDVGGLDVAGEAITITAWFYATDLANCGSRDCRLISKVTSVSEQGHYFMVSTIAAGATTRLRFRLKTGNTTTTLIATTGNLVENQWIHVAAVYDGATMTLYQDGTPVGSRTKTGTIATNPTIPVWIGGNPSGATHRPWNGSIDDTRIYNRALTPQQIQTLATGR